MKNILQRKVGRVVSFRQGCFNRSFAQGAACGQAALVKAD
jgi:hypothetical protein